MAEKLITKSFERLLDKGKSRGFAFVVFKDKEIADTVASAAIKPFKGRDLYLKRPTPGPKESFQQIQF